jgi:hypothetical protein
MPFIYQSAKYQKHIPRFPALPAAGKTPLLLLISRSGKLFIQTLTYLSIMRLNLFLFCLVLFASIADTNAQNTELDFPELTIGEWREHLPWQRARSVTSSATHVYFGTEWAVVEIDKTDRSTRFLSKIEGLSEVGIQKIRYNHSAKALFIAYSNSNIDLFYPASNKTVNLPFILKNTVLSGDKTVKDLFFENEFAYISTAFGVVKLDMIKGEVVFTVFTGVPVRSFALYKNNYYMGTEDGLFRLSITDNNPADFSRWQLLGAAQGLIAGLQVNALAVFNDYLYAGIAGIDLIRYDGGSTVVQLDQQTDLDIAFMTREGQGLVIAWKNGETGKATYLNSSETPIDIHVPCELYRPLDIVEDGNQTFWMADAWDKFRYYNHATGSCDFFTFNSPYDHQSTEIALRGNKVFVATLGADQNLNPIPGRLGLYVLDDDGQWKRYNGDSNPELTTDNCHEGWWRVTPHPTEEKVYIGSFTSGLIELSDDATETKCFNKNNSTLGDAGAAGANRTAIGGMAFDLDGNLWICNYGADKPIAVLKPDGTLSNFSVPGGGNFLKVVIDNNGYKWFVSAFTGGLSVYDSGADIDDPSDDQYKIINTANSVLATNEVTSVAVDLNGYVWVGTKEGLYSFQCTGAIFGSNNCTRGIRQIVTVDGFNGYLLQDEFIKTIAVDGANRKWVGTTNGIFVQSPDGKTTLQRFDITNSPLPSNTIETLAIHPSTGEVWIGTTKGIVSYRSDATAGGKINSGAAFAYPNPVLPEYDGPIAVYGLARDANVKITDASGNLVYEGKANGGQAVWNGRDYLGKRVASGVYLIYATSSSSFEDPDAIITKVVIIN